MSQYVVTGACAYLTQVNAVDGKLYRTLLYQGALVPESATEAEIEHNLASGLIGPASILADQDEVLLLQEPSAPVVEDVVLEEPARNASTEAWLEFALAKGAQLEDVQSLKRDELVELFGTPTGS